MSVNVYLYHTVVYTHMDMYMYTYMYILFMRVFDGCHAVTKLVFAEVSTSTCICR